MRRLRIDTGRIGGGQREAHLASILRSCPGLRSIASSLDKSVELVMGEPGKISIDEPDERDDSEGERRLPEFPEPGARALTVGSSGSLTNSIDHGAVERF